MSCSICLGFNKQNYVADEVFLDVVISKLITSLADIDDSLIGGIIICVDCALSLYQANAVRNKIRNIFKSRGKSIAVPTATKDRLMFTNDTEIGQHVSGSGSSKKVKKKFDDIEQQNGSQKYQQSNQRKHRESQHNSISSKIKSRTNNKISKPKLTETKACPNCGGVFRAPTFNMHFFGEKCSTSILPCQEPSCRKKFSNMKIMRVHMTKCHPLSIYNIN